MTIVGNQSGEIRETPQKRTHAAPARVIAYHALNFCRYRRTPCTYGQNYAPKPVLDVLTGPILGSPTSRPSGALHVHQVPAGNCVWCVCARLRVYVRVRVRVCVCVHVRLRVRVRVRVCVCVCVNAQAAYLRTHALVCANA